MIAQQEQSAALVDQAEHDPEGACVVGAVIREISKLHHEAVRGGGIAECGRVTVHVANHPDVTAQALRLGNALKEAGVPVTVFGARESTHNKLNNDLGVPDDPATKALYEFLDRVLKK